MRITGRRTLFRVSDTRRSALSQARRIRPVAPRKPAPASRIHRRARRWNARAAGPGLVCETCRHACTQVTALLS